ncbi:PREDICTED: transmembrane protein 177 [Dufourea novaeangliae]|uniref:transmembrane protein 177 n=1 Tax=Dufourea novaeangliae TaxID=178035 RepID=UPI000766E65A|nr:PREDICTED: transmembrane protein 177 [Dufourea novaeangliae]
MSLRHFVLLGSTVGASCAIALPNTYFLEKYRQIRAKYRIDQTEITVSEKCQKRFQEVLDDLKLSEELKERIKLFHVYGNNVFSAGTLHKHHGLVIGIPMNFEYENIDSIDKDMRFLENKFVDWNSKIAKDFLKSLIFSENAQKFSIAREILMTKQSDQRLCLLQLFMHITIVYGLYDMIVCRPSKLSPRKNLIRYVFGSIFFIVGIAVWIAIRDLSVYESEIKVDELLSKLGPKYIQGGNEFYNKLLNRNIALRSLLGDDGKKLFTVNGNDNYLIRHRGVPLFYRKSYFDSKLQNIEQLI